MREALDSPDLDSRAGGALPLELHQALAAPALQATVPDLEFAHAVLVLDCEPVDDAPILDLRIRKGVRRHGVRLAVATSRPSALDPNAALVAAVSRPAPARRCWPWRWTPRWPAGDWTRWPRAAGRRAEDVRRALARLPARRRRGRRDRVGRAAGHGPARAHAVRALLNVAGAPEARRRGRRRPARDPGRRQRARACARRACCPTPGRGRPRAPAAGGRSAAEIAAGAGRRRADGALPAARRPAAHPPRPRAVGARAPRATTVIAHAPLLTEGLREHATVVFPAEAYAEKEGTVTHPDGRVQRLRPAIGHPRETRAGVAACSPTLAPRSATTSACWTGADGHRAARRGRALLRRADARGDRRPRRALAGARGGDGARRPRRPGPFELERPPAAPAPNGALRLGTFRSIWASPEVEVSPALKFLAPEPSAELSPADARAPRASPTATGSRSSPDGVAVRAAARACARRRPPGTVFLEDGDGERRRQRAHQRRAPAGGGQRRP